MMSESKFGGNRIKGNLHNRSKQKKDTELFLYTPGSG